MRGASRSFGIGIGIALLALVVAAIGAAWFVIGTQNGTRWALHLANRTLPGELIVASTRGSIAGPLLVEDLRYTDRAAGIDVQIDRLELDIDMRSLWYLQLHVRTLDIAGIRTALVSAPPEPEPAQREPFTLDAPIDMRIERFRLTDGRLEHDGQPLLNIDSAVLSGTWIDQSVRIDQLDLHSDRGEIHVQGAAAGGEPYAVDADGRFRWEATGRTYAGTLQIGSDAPRVTAIATLRSPLPATLQLEVEQRAALPWTLRLDVPRFDPREGLLPDSSLRSLAASLTGEGDRVQGTVAGTVTLNDEVLQIERLHAQQSDGRTTLAAVLRPPQGEIRLDGTLALADPATTQVALAWESVVLPASWAGQELSTQGSMQLKGRVDRYDATGSMHLGPPGRIANISFDLQGEPARIELRRFDVEQKQGHVQVSGAVDLQPLIAWRLAASAESFDPGEFFVAWPGNLDFDLKTAGRWPQSGPEATLQLSGFSGDLRGHDIRGRADLTLPANRVLSGELHLSAGDNHLDLTGKPGDRIAAQVRIDAPALAVLMPQMQGAVRGVVNATGDWPHLQTSGELRARSLQLEGVRAQRIDLRFDMDDPLDPRGRMTLEAEQLALGGLTFATLNARAQGSAAEHSLQVQVDGERLAGQLQLQGSRTGRGARGWSGRIEQLLLDVVGTTKVALQKPVEIEYAPPRIRVSQACLAGTDLRLCARGHAEAAGAFDVAYSLDDLPLELISRVVPALPVALTGHINGEGHLQRDANGILAGSASLVSEHGEVARILEAQPDSPQVLLRYDDLRLQARLQDRQASATLVARLNERGQLRGEARLLDAGSAAASMQGNLAADLPSIAVIGAFVPQVANLQGRLSVRADISGPVDAPSVNGEARLAALSADLPALGLKLRAGELRVQPQTDGTYAIDGSISSGDGTLRLEGSAAPQGTVRVNATGKRFLAADIPGARVVIDPTLLFVGEPQRMALTGSVHIPSADINVQKLPRSESTQSISEDVVVIDATTREEEEREAIPLHAAVDVTLGDAVKLAGFGLDATVAGQLRVREEPGAPTTGSGEVRVTGTYKAYGQDLTIRQGHLLFAGTPLDNPRLNIVAVREVEPVLAGLRVEGSAQNPQLTVFAEPTMSESNALSYLIAGKPLSDIDEGEGDAVQSAARALGTAAGGLLAKNIGRRLGVDELGIKDSEALGGSALTIGQYLSPRLYLSYGVGLFEPGEVVTLRYKLSDKATVEVLNGPIDSRAGVEYRMEK